MSQAPKPPRQRQHASSELSIRPRAGSVSPPAGEEFLSVGDVAELFRVDPKTVARWARAGRLPHFRTPGGHRRFRRTDIERYLRSL